MTPLIDGDLIAYRCAASCQKQGVVTEDLSVAQARANDLLVRIVHEVGGTDEPQIFLSGGDNYRKTIFPEYKANRVDQERPVYLEPLREWLVVNWRASVTDGIEADDALGIRQTYFNENDIPSIICSLDKDLLQVPGNHYSWDIGTSTWTKAAIRRTVSPQEGLFHFYWQLIMGDRADNVPGFDGKMRQTVPKFLESHYENMRELETEQELFNYVKEIYQLPLLQMLTHGACLWVQRYEGEMWLEKGKHLLEKSGMGELGQKEDITLLSPQP